MQHTLVPPHERSLLRREYHVRAWIVALFAFSLAGAIGVAGLFPAFMRGTLEERLQLAAIASLEENKNASNAAAIEQELASDKILLAALADGTNQKLLSAEIGELISRKGSVRLASIAVNRLPEGKVKMIIQGTAPTRESLLSLKTRIETQVPGAAVTLPISQLAKSANIQFSLEIILPKL
jgi:hypothetical protein